MLGSGTVTVERAVDPAVRVTVDGARVAVKGVAGPTVPAPATDALRVTVPWKLFWLATVITEDAETPTGASRELGVASTLKSGGGTVTATWTV